MILTGKSHDAKAFKDSTLGREIAENPENLFPEGSYLLGDLGYPSLPQLLTPYKGKYLSNDKRRFNKILRGSRSVVERAFALLKSRFRRLDHVCGNLKTCVDMIQASVIFHNVINKY